MKLKRIACLTGLVALSAWSVACSDDTTATPGGPDGGDGETGGSSGAGGKGAGGTAGTAGKGGGGTSGSSGSTGKAGAAGAAGSAGDSGVEPGDGGDPGIKITDPKDLETISKDAEYADFPKIPVEFTLTNFVLMPPASGATKCPKTHCGHVHLNVDGNACNAAPAPYNAAAVASPGIIDLALCPGVAGAHTITASLHNDDHSDVLIGDSGTVVSDTITITAKPGDGGTTAPDAGDGG